MRTLKKTALAFVRVLSFVIVCIVVCGRDSRFLLRAVDPNPGRSGVHTVTRPIRGVLARAAFVDRGTRMITWFW